MQIAVIGLGYVGLVSGACLADFGHVVTCVDNDELRIADLKAGRMPIYEPGLQALVESNRAEGRLAFTSDLAGAVKAAHVVFIAVGTPTREGSLEADMSYVYAAAEEIAAAIKDFTVIVNKSTVPVGTGDEVEKIIRTRQADADFAVVSNPEFLREGSAIYDFKHPDRIVVGTDDPRANVVIHEVYRPLYLNAAPFLFTTRRTAELIKYAANAFLATKVAFINEIADICEKAGADVQDVARGMGLDNRIGQKFLHAGPGFGGSCFPKDTLALVHTARTLGAPIGIVEAVESGNKRRKRGMVDKVVEACGGTVAGKTVAMLGLSFKQNTDDVRESAAIDIARALLAAGAVVRAYDPKAMEKARPLMPEATFCPNAYDCAQGASALVIVTEWDVYRALDLERLKGALAEPVVVDLRNMYHPAEMRRRGFRYTSVGRP